LRKLFVTAFFFSGFAAQIGLAQKCATGVPAQLKSIKAMLYYNDTGKFSDNLIDNADFVLWNAIIGEGSAAGPSTSMFVVVEVMGDAKPNICQTDSLTVTIQQTGKPASRRQVSRLSFYGTEAGVQGSYVAKQNHFEAFWVYETGCLPVTITAQVNQQKSVTKTIDFQCGE
jgi:hypothetical protein